MKRTVRIKNGMIKGLPAADPRITVYKGIPFAAPPVGKNRWRAPQPAEDWEGTLNAFEFAPIPMQEKPGLDPDNIYTREWHCDPDIPMSEDCLYLNVWTPSKTGDEKLPVMVWFFGGGLNSGYTAEMEFDGERLAKRGVVVVSAAYRVNVFGFLAHPDLTKANDENCITNFGLYDQRYSIKWVNENIAAFGGDPDNVTIFGQSGGGRSVLMQSVTPLNDMSMFQKVISMSGSGITVGFIEYDRLKKAEQDGVHFLESIGAYSIEDARKVSAEDLEAASLAQHDVRWGAVVDERFLPDQPAVLLKSGRQMPVSIMAGHTTADLWPSFNHIESLEAYKEEACRRFGADAEEFLKKAEFEEGNLEKCMENASINQQRLCVETLAKKRASMNMPFYFYRFGPSMPGWDNPGAFHSSDLWFAFESLGKCWRPFTGKHYELARIMCNYWANFAKKGDPNGLDADGSPMPEWIPYTEKTPWSMELKEDPYMSHVNESDAADWMMEYYLR